MYEKIKAAVSLKDAAESYGLTVSRNGMARCPFHDDHSPSLKLNEDYYYCFGCGEQGDVIDFTAKLFGKSRFWAAKKLELDFGLLKSGKLTRFPSKTVAGRMCLENRQRFSL